MKKMTRPLHAFLLRTMLVVLISKVAQTVYTIWTSTYDNRTSEMIFWGCMFVGFMLVYFQFKKLTLQYLSVRFQELRDLRTNYYEKKRSISTSYTITRIALVKDTPLTVGLYFKETLQQKAMPEVDMNGTRISVTYVHPHLAYAHCKLAASTTMEDIDFSIGEKLFPFANPFKIDLENANVQWQCEGHAPEKKIWITLPKELPVNFSYVLPFRFLINGTVMCDLIGVCHGNKITIAIPGVRKAQCLNKICSIKLAYGNQYGIALPRPVVASINKVPVPIRESK